jgi:hypothetical protein
VTAPAVVTSQLCDSEPAETTLPTLLAALPLGLRAVRRDDAGNYRSLAAALAIRTKGDLAQVLDSAGRWLTLGDPGVSVEAEDDPGT